MKYNLLSRFLFFSLLIIFASCDDINEEERLIFVEPAPVGRAVLIEDFTGQRCVNCPTATEDIEALQEQYGEENIIAVGIHCEPRGFSGNAKMSGLMNEEGVNYGRHWGVETQPIGMVNRVGGLKDRTEWFTAVYNEIQKTSPVDMKLQLKYSAEEGTLDIETDITALYDTNASLQLWLVQDGIVAPQSMPNGSQNREYVHKHVFRAAINGAWGEAFELKSGEEKLFEHSFTLDNSTLSPFVPQYIPEDCAVVAFVYDGTGVLQVVKASVDNE